MGRLLVHFCLPHKIPRRTKLIRQLALVAIRHVIHMQMCVCVCVRMYTYIYIYVYVCGIILPFLLDYNCFAMLWLVVSAVQQCESVL